MKTSDTLYCAMNVAASIIHYSSRIGYRINYLHLQKLLYFVQAYSFILYGNPIFADDIYATEYGVKIPDVELYYGKFGSIIIDDESIKADIYYQIRDKDLDMIERVVYHFKNRSSVDLTDIIYKHKPWKDAICMAPKLITKKSLRDYFYHPEKEFKDQPKRSESKPKKYRIKSSIVRNFFGVCTIMTCIVLGLRIDIWICQNAHFLLVAIHLILKLICFIFIMYGLRGNTKTYEEAFSDLEKKLRSAIFEEID